MGLSGRDALAPDAGMWFDFGVQRTASIWMRGMRFPIDIVWVDEGLVVVEVTHDAPVPEPGTAIADLPRYTANTAVHYVLEINAGLARALGIHEGAAVALAGF